MQSYTLTAHIGRTVQWNSHTARVFEGEAKKQIGPFRVSTLPLSGRPFRFVAMGDSRTYPKDWASVANAVVQKNPALVLFSGDMVTDGREDHQWDAEFFGVVKPYFASIPTFYVVGNHEEGSPLVGSLVPVAACDHWKATAGGALLIGIDGALDWAASSTNLKWLETTLKENREPFIFLCSHYPPWSSGVHGATARAHEHRGPPEHPPVAEKVSCNRVHCRPRSRLRAIRAARGSDGHRQRRRAGAPLYPKLPLGQNPHSKVFHCKHHFCLFTIDGNQCTMQVLTPEGTLLDSKSWAGRQFGVR